MIVGMFRFRKVCFFALLLIVYFNSNVCYGMEEFPAANKNGETKESEYDTNVNNRQLIGNNLNAFSPNIDNNVNNSDCLSFNIINNDSNQNGPFFNIEKNNDNDSSGELNNNEPDIKKSQGEIKLNFFDHNNSVPDINQSQSGKINLFDFNNNNNVSGNNNQNEGGTSYNLFASDNDVSQTKFNQGPNMNSRNLGQSNNQDMNMNYENINQFDNQDPNMNSGNLYQSNNQNMNMNYENLNQFDNQDPNMNSGNLYQSNNQNMNMSQANISPFASINPQSLPMQQQGLDGTALQNPIFGLGNNASVGDTGTIVYKNNSNPQSIINSQNDPNFQNSEVNNPNSQSNLNFQGNNNLNSTPIGEGLNSQGQESMIIYKISKGIDNIDIFQNNINNAQNRTEVLDVSSAGMPNNESGFNNNINNNINSNSINNINKNINSNTSHNKLRAPGRINLASTGGGESSMPEQNDFSHEDFVHGRCVSISGSLYNNSLDCVSISEVLEGYVAALKEKWEEINALKQIVVNLEELGLAQAEGGEGVDDNKANDNIKKGNVLNDGKKELVTSQQQETNNAIINENKNQLVDSGAERPQVNLIDNKSVVLGEGQNGNVNLNLNDDENQEESVLSGGNPEEALPAEDIFFDEDVSSLKNVTMEKMKLETDFYGGHVGDDLYGGIRCFSDEFFTRPYLDSFHGLTEQEVKLFENISEKGKADALRKSCLTRIDNLKKEINDLECRNLVFQNMLGLNENIMKGLLPEIQKSLSSYWFFYDRFRRGVFTQMYDYNKFNLHKSSGNRFFSFFRSIPNEVNDITGFILDFLNVECQVSKKSFWTVLDELASFCKGQDVASQMAKKENVVLKGDNNEMLIVDSSLFKVVSEHVSSLAFAKDLIICLNNIRLSHLKKRVKAIASAFGNKLQQVKIDKASNPVPCRVVHNLNSLEKEVPHFLKKCSSVNTGSQKLTVIQEEVFKQLMTDFIVANVRRGNIDSSILPLLQNIGDVKKFCLKEVRDAIEKRIINLDNKDLDDKGDLLELLKKFTADKKIDIKDFVDDIEAGLPKLKEKVDTFHGHAASDLQKEISFMSKDSMYRNKISEYKNAIEGLYLSKRPFYFVAYRVFKPIASFVWSFVNSIKKYEDVSEVNKLYFFAPFFCVGYRYKSSSMPFWLDHIDVNFNFLGGVLDVASYVLFRHFSLKHFYYGVSNCAMMDYSYADFLCYAFFSFFNVNINIKCSDFFFSLNLVGILRAIILPIIDMYTRKTSALNPVFVRVNKAYEAIQSEYNMLNEHVEKYRGMNGKDCADIFFARLGELSYCPLVPYSHPGDEGSLLSALRDLLLNLQQLSS